MLLRSLVMLPLPPFRPLVLDNFVYVFKMFLVSMNVKMNADDVLKARQRNDSLQYRPSRAARPVDPSASPRSRGTIVP